MHVVVFFFGNMVDTKKKNMILNLACQFSPDIISYLWVCSLAWLHNVTHTVHSLILRIKNQMALFSDLMFLNLQSVFKVTKDYRPKLSMSNNET